MVILKFNRLIRNKWVWGVFALIVSIAFVAPNGCLYGSDSKAAIDSINKISKADFDAKLYEQSDYLVRGRILDFVGLSQFFDAAKTESTWKVYAALLAFNDAGVEVSDEQLSERIRMNSMFADPKTKKFDQKFYAAAVQSNFRLTVHQFEEYLRLALKLQIGLAAVAADQAGLSSAVIEQEAYDFSDKFTVRIATFTEDKAAADKIKVTAEDMGAYFNKNKDAYAFPDRYKVRYVKLNMRDPAILAKVMVSDDQIKARYEENKESGLYDVNTNDTVIVKTLDEVRERIVVDLKNEAARTSLEEEVASAMPDNSESEKAAKFLDEFAAKKGVKVQTSDWFSFGGNRISGFVKPVQLEFPGVDVAEFKNKVRDLVDADLNTISTENSLWIFQSAGVSEAFEPKFDEAAKAFVVPTLDEEDEEVKKEVVEDAATKAKKAEFDKKMKAVVGPKALDNAKAEYFKSTVEAIIKKGADAVLKTANVSTNIVFQPCAFAKQAYGWANQYGWDFSKAGFDNAAKVVPASRKLAKGGVSEFILLSKGRAAVVVCQDRVAGNAADYERGMEFARGIDMMHRYTALPVAITKWLDTNLLAYGYKGDVLTENEDSSESATEK